jgi:hypothetical protein
MRVHSLLPVIIGALLGAALLGGTAQVAKKK